VSNIGLMGEAAAQVFLSAGETFQMAMRARAEEAKTGRRAGERRNMENQHRQIKGYRELDATEIAAMNEVKELAAKTGELVEKIKASGADIRWASIGATQLQQGFMALTRSIAKPGFF